MNRRSLPIALLLCACAARNPEARAPGVERVVLLGPPTVPSKRLGQQGAIEVEPAEEVLRVRWKRLLTEPGLIEYKPQEFASATSDGRRVFVGSRGGTFWALSPRDGGVLWKHHIDGGVGSQPLYMPAVSSGDELRPVGAGTVYVGGSDGAMHAFDAATGHERFAYKTKGPIGGTPVSDGNLVYFSNGENRVYAIDARTGAWKWQYERESPDSFTIRGYAGPLLYGGRVYAGFSDGYLVALNARTGDVIWTRSLAADAQRFIDVDATPTLVDGVLYVSSYAGGVYAISPADGVVKWRFPVEGAGTVVVDGKRIYFGAAKAGLHCIDTDGNLLWRQSLAAEGELSTPVLIGARFVLLSASEGGTYVADRSDGHLLQFFSPGHGVTSAPVSDGRQVYVLTNAGFLYAFALRSG